VDAIAIYPGTFDPLTHGHGDIITRAAKIFDQLIIAVSKNRLKKPLFSIAERVELVHAVTHTLSNVTILEFDELLIDFAQRHHANILLRSLRSTVDFEYEVQLAGLNRHLAPDLETVFLSPDVKYSHISSSLVKEIALYGGDVANFVAPPVAAALADKAR
jgi:pantetheine-phosphate adenylyltransferase